MTEARKRWTADLTGYHWFVFLVASGAWLFDCLDQRLFTLARVPALTALLPADTDSGVIQATGKEVTAIFLVGWGIGGMLFGAMGDRYGRARMLNITVLIYSLFTGLTFFSQSFWDFAACRFLTGLGVGGVFGLAVALIAETLPDASRTGALGMLQVLSTIGNVSAGLFNSWIGNLQTQGVIEQGEGWRYMFLVGAIPAVMVIATGKYLHEPERWLRAKAEGQLPKGSILSPYRGLLSDPRWRKNLIVGSLLKFSGFIAWVLWLVIHLINLVSFRNRLLVLVQWGWNYVTYDRSARLITNAPSDIKRCEQPSEKENENSEGANR